MAIFTFSTRGSAPKDAETIEEAKKHCRQKGLNFSAIVVKLIKEWLANERQNEV